MKPLLKIYLCLFTSLLFIAACDDSDEEGITGFTIDTQEVTLGAIGGMEPVKVASGTKWVAKVDQPWVKVMPANGVGSTNCEIVVDSTLSNDVRHAVVTFVPEGQPKQELKIHQTGYGKMIGLDKYEVEVANMANDDKRYFDISVTTNVKFKVEYSQAIGSWVTTNNRTPDVSLDYGARPRTLKMRFKWDMNTDPQERIASIKFLPVNAEDELEKEVTLTVKQEAAPEITDDRRGDSIAIVIASTKMRSMMNWDASERLDYWLGVTVWERTDKDVTPEKIGRVRSVEFRLLNTKEVLTEIALEIERDYGKSTPVIFTGHYSTPYSLVEDYYVSYGSWQYRVIAAITDKVDPHLKEKYFAPQGYCFTGEANYPFIQWAFDAFDGTNREMMNFLEMHGHSFPQVTDPEILEQARTIGDTMPEWPADGSVSLQDGYILVHI